MKTLIERLKNNLATENAVTVLGFAFGWGCLWEGNLTNTSVMALSNIFFVLFLIAVHLYKSKLNKEGKEVPKPKRNNRLLFWGILWFIAGGLQVIGGTIMHNEQIMSITTQAAEIILICGLAMFAINNNTKKYIA
jgi:lipoprotein